MRRALVAVALTALSLAGMPAAAQDDGAVETVTGLSEPVYTESVTESYEVPTDHGTIYGEVIRPVVPDGVPVPVILTYSPYNVLSQLLDPGGSIANDATAEFFVPRGYARAVFDVVGTRSSGGCYDYGGVAERETGRDVVDFLGSQEWSSGRVGMIGGSYDGTTQWAAAIEQPDHLTTIVPQVAIDRWYDYAFGGGIRYFLNNERPSDEGFDTPLAFDFGFGLLPPTDPTRPSPSTTQEAIAGRINPCERIEHTDAAYAFDPVYDEFWEERDYRRQAEDIRAAVLVEGGWLDHNVKHWNSTRMFMALPGDLPKRLVMGQWAHTSNQHEDAGDLLHAWFDHWLLGLDTGVMEIPPVDTQIGGTGERVQEPSWPPPGTAPALLPLEAAPAEEAPPALFLLGAEEPTWQEQQPPTTEEELLASTSSPRGTHLHFRTAPLQEAVRISGSPLLALDVTTDGTSAHFTPVLYEVTAEGAVRVITRGFLNARNRHGLDVSEAVVPGDPYRAAIELWDTDYEVAAGGQIGLVVASGNADWVLPDDDEQGANTLAFTSSTLTLPVSRGHEAVGARLEPELSRIAGSSRVETAAAVAAEAFSRADTVVVATAADYPDALAGGPLAAALDSPLLLTRPDALDAAAAAEVTRLGATEAVLLGGAAALSEQVASDLADLGTTVRRVAGVDRFATAAAIAEEVVAASGAESVPFVVEGEHADPARGWPDAVAVAPLAAFTGQPILLVNAMRLPEPTRAALDGLGVTAATVVGGPAAVSEEVVDAVTAQGVEVTRVAGADRYATSALLHAEMVSDGMDPVRLWLATGADWPDALAAGPAVASLGHTLALIAAIDLDDSPDTAALVTPEVLHLRLLGGSAAISMEVEEALAARLAG